MKGEWKSTSKSGLNHSSEVFLDTPNILDNHSVKSQLEKIPSLSRFFEDFHYNLGNPQQIQVHYTLQANNGEAINNCAKFGVEMSALDSL